MAFTTEELQLITKQIPFLHDEYYGRNLIIINDYLNGTSTDLSQLNKCSRNFNLGSLFNLITTTDTWSNKEDLVMDVLQSPNIKTSIQFENTSLRQLLNLNTQKAFDKLLKILRSYALSDQEIMSFLILNIHLHPSNPFFQADSPYSVFVLVELQKAPTTTLDNLSNAVHQHTFSFQYSIYHWLLTFDRSRSTGYLKKCFKVSLHSVQHTLETVLSYDYKRHFATILFLTSKLDQITTINQAQLWFRIKLLLFKYDPEPDTSGILKEAERYLVHYSAAKFNEPSEHQFEYTIDPTNKNQLYEFSTIALFIVLSTNKELGLEFYKKIVAHGQPMKSMHLELVCNIMPKEALPFVLLALTRPADSPYFKGSFPRFVVEKLNVYPYESYKEDVFKFDKISSKIVRNLLVQHIIQRDPNPIKEALLLLQHKKADIRLIAVQLLSSIGSEEALQTIRASLDAEKNDDARDAMLHSLTNEESVQNNEADLAQLITSATNRGKLAEAIVPWFETVNLPPIYLKSGRTATQEETRFLFYRMSRSKEMRSDLEARPMLRLIDTEKSDAFALKLFKEYIDKGCDVKQKYVITIAALLGGEDLVNKLRMAINDWIDGGRKVMAEYGILALAIQGSNKALRWVEWYSRKYKSKKAFVGEMALLALDAAAAELNISRNELGDRIVPDFGFEGLFKTFEINGEQYRAFIDNKFKITFLNEDNKKLKSLPSTASAELKETFKDIAKELRDVVKSQSMRLEHYLVSQRVWDAAAWSGFFLQNPIMFTYATRLLWQVRHADGTTTCFICQEDTTLVNKSEEEIQLKDGDSVVMAHPYFIDATELEQWKRWYFDQEMEELFPQLDRKLFKVEESKKQSKIYTELENSKTETGIIRSSLEKRGWGKCGGTEDGMIECFFKEDVESSVRAMLEVSGVNITGYDYDNDPTIGRLYFLSLTNKNKAMWLMSPKNEGDERLVAFGAIPPVLYSEILSDLHAIKIKELVG